MAYFWSIIAALVLVTGVLRMTRPDPDARAESARSTITLGSWASGSEIPAPIDAVVADGLATDLAEEPRAADAEAPDLSAPVEGSMDALAAAAAENLSMVANEALGRSEAETGMAENELAEAGAAETETAETAASGDIVIDPEVLERLAQKNTPDTDAAPQADAGPGYTVEPDGSITIGSGSDAARIPGSGTASSPYLVSWDVLRGVQRQYDPRAGKRDLPEWLGALDGKAVRLEGNTLVPVVASETTELLLMQNPWDGCCIGVPPTPYDAIEVSLNEATTFGYSAVGYGTIQGTFVVDPYEVSGWLMGLFLIEDASYTSGDGVALPEL